VNYGLAQPFGAVSPSTQSKSWFFELPQWRDNTEAWTELVNRIYYDANVRMRSREPDDTSWLAVDSVTITPVSGATMLAWDGVASEARAAVHLPWVLSHSAIIWEFSACYFVDDAGAYDGMTAYDFSELVVYRMLEAGQASPQEARIFLQRLYPAAGDAVFADREARFANLLGVRPTPEFRRPPDSEPWISGPVRPNPA